MSIETTAEDVLSFLLWNAEKLTMPTFRNLTKSFEQWDYENSVRFHLRRLERRQLVERMANRDGVHYRLSESGRLAALGGLDPVPRWQRSWDGQWRIVLFDIARRRQAARAKLLRWLRERRFGFLQNSVWIQPDPLTESIQSAISLGGGVESLLVMEARCGLSFSNADVVAAAWDFTSINQLYEEYLAIWQKERSKVERGRISPAELVRLLRRERLAWSQATWADPFLPHALLPGNYLGRAAWRARQQWLSVGRGT
jgi:phenylacetic acid degradation operon negative regulatory protein